MGERQIICGRPPTGTSSIICVEEAVTVGREPYEKREERRCVFFSFLPSHCAAFTLLFPPLAKCLLCWFVVLRRPESTF